MERVRILPYANHFARIGNAKHKQATNCVGESANSFSYCGEITSTPLEFRSRAFAAFDSFSYR